MSNKTLQMSNLTKLYQISDLINKSQLYFQTENRLVLNEYIQTLIQIEQEYV
jgi:hypothetical protein